VDRVTRRDEGGLALLTLNRPEKRNALDTASFEELDAHFTQIAQQADRIGCVVLRGSGSAFCAGADLNAIGKAPIDARLKPRIIERVGCLPQPVIAAVHGACLTGGLELALACDFIVADKTARFADTHGKWGLVSAWGMSQRLPRRIGASRAKLMMMTSRTLAATEAFEIGLIDLLAEEGGLDQLLSSLVTDILANSWHTNFAVKRLLRETEGLPLALGLAHEHYNYPGFAPDHDRRISEFKSTRKPGDPERAPDGDRK
jgi:enoyl-CoA hydratase